MLEAVNFFGHAAIADRYDSRQPFVFGAMLPDFVTMLRLGRIRPKSGLLASGIAFHHATDAVFHDSSTFLELSQDARVRLLAGGLTRGPARAVAHIGVELLLDEALASEADARSAYLGAIAGARQIRSEIEFRSAADSDRLGYLLGLLADRGLAGVTGSAEQLAERIQRALRGRPRLELRDGTVELVRDWIVATRTSIPLKLPALMKELHSGLGKSSCVTQDLRTPTSSDPDS